MNEMQFLNDFARLDHFCQDIMEVSERGVTAYLNEMEKLKYTWAGKVSGWNTDYATLKMLRNLRNGLAHGSAERDCTEDDFLKLQSLYDRFLQRDDPLSRKENILREEKRRAKAQATVAPSITPRQSDSYGDYPQFYCQPRRPHKPTFWERLKHFFFPSD